MHYQMIQEDYLPILFHLDMDQFYAAVEMRKNPELKKYPLIVGNPKAKQTKRGVVLTCNYEARKFGVRSGMPMNEALKKCPDAIISNDARDEYNPTSKRIFSLLNSLSVITKQTSIDEAYIDISPLFDDYTNAYHFAKTIQKLILEKEKLSCSIGIAPTKILAKMASDYNKPNGITVITPANVDKFISTRKLQDIPGIGKVSSQKLEQKGYTHCKQLVKLSKYELIATFGDLGSRFYDIVNLNTSNTLKFGGLRKSISQERTFHGKPGDTEYTEIIIHKIIDKLYKSLVNQEFSAKTITTKIRFNDYSTITRASSYSNAIQDIEKMRYSVQELIKPHIDDSRGIRLIGVRLSNLIKLEIKQKKLTDYF